MSVFISWSGESSLKSARIIQTWLETVLEELEVDLKIWLSEDDIPKGTLWFAELDEALKSCDFGLICLNKSNINASWLIFEAGAIFSTLGTGCIAPILLEEGISLEGPLEHIQLTKVNEVDFTSLVNAICESNNKEVSIKKIHKVVVDRFSQLDRELNSVRHDKRSIKKGMVECRICESFVEQNTENCPNCGAKDPNIRKHEQEKFMRAIILSVSFLGLLFTIIIILSNV